MRREELNPILQKEVIVKIAKELMNLLNEIENKLKTLEVGKVLDVSNLTKEEAKAISQTYSKQYFMNGPLEDKNNNGKYVLAFMVNYRGKENA